MSKPLRLLFLLPCVLLSVQCKTPGAGVSTGSTLASKGHAASTGLRLWVGFRRPALSVEAFPAAARKIQRPAMLLALAPDEQLAHGVFERPLPEMVMVGKDENDAGKRLTYEGDFWQVADAGKSVFYDVQPLAEAEFAPTSPFARARAYDVMGSSLDVWDSGTTTVTVRATKSSAAAGDVLNALLAHAKSQAASLSTQGLKGYVVVSDRGFVVEAMNWSQQAPATATNDAVLAAVAEGEPLVYSAASL